MGTKKGQVRKTARRAYEPKKNPYLKGPMKSRTNLEIFKYARWEGASFKNALKFAFSRKKK